MTTLERLKPWLTMALGLALGASAGYYLAPAALPVPSRDAEIRQTGFAFIRPLLECEVDNPSPTRHELRYFKNDLEKAIEAVEDGERVQTVAVYFRDLNNGPWVGVKEEKGFTPASLFKVPLVMACLMQSEIIPGWLDIRVKYQGLPDELLGRYHYPPAATLEVGREYTVRDLIDRTARYSDNGAAWMLQQAVDPSILSRVYSDLGLNPVTSLIGPLTTISATTYGRFFRILYNATYLNRPNSELALRTFANSVFSEGLVAGVPNGTIVSHKFGEKMKVEEGVRTMQLHDVGIVYHPQAPYLLCVMTLGTDYTAQAAAIASISRFVWNEVSEGR